MTTLKRDARVAGLIYLALTLIAPFRLIYIPGQLFVHGDAAATAHNIAAHELLFRLGIFGDLLTGVVSLFLTFTLYHLFKGVDKKLAALMFVLGFMDTPLYFFNTLNDVAALLLVHGGDVFASLDPSQRDALAMLFLRMHGGAISCAEMFWGLWLFPLAALVIRSRFLPRFLGYWLILNGLAYLALCVAGVVLPQYEDTVSSIAFPLQLGEVAFVLWLVVMGARPRGEVAPVPAGG
ncbi:DUF4386 domain-containing protein [Dyella japonica]|uniref:DUF4386 domain-containing protein n=1 Tax=Dyella japonica A8 TaxID=1217721 RepID=A0A075K2U6_9GAMM|nr:DUF4386 domain-containing protein [Dyella japonica]AIF48325.1 hypothetical protein HY57_14260 [Dyella japonica A8]